ncbi:YfiR family protein [Oscillatoria amoena NRMC-F 0135]|nr:YfiR family protein [Oscillatoria amoena NRMC-F 0135]
MKKLSVMKKIILFAIATAFSLGVALAQERPNHEIHAAMVFNFIKYVQWPDEGSSGEFVVGVMGEDDVYNTLKTWYDGKPKGAKKYVVKKLSSASEAASCHVVYLGKTKSKEFENIKSNISGKPVLTVTDGSGLGQKGSCINFKVIDGKLKWELNQGTITGSNLKVSGQLSSMSILI